MVTDLHAKKSGQYLQAFRKKKKKNAEKRLITKISPKPVILPKINGA